MVRHPIAAALSLVAAAGLFIGEAACARATPIDTAPVAAAEPAPAQGELAATLAVTNNSIFDVRIYVLRGGQRYRMGIVGSGTTVSYGLTRLLINREISLYAEPVGARGHQRTESIVVREGQEVRLELEKRLRSHSLAVY